LDYDNKQQENYRLHCNGRWGDLGFLKELIENGRIRSVLDRCYPMEEIVIE
jgi:hypothetical protein